MSGRNITSSGRYSNIYSGETISQSENPQSGWSRKQIMTLVTVMSAQFCILSSYSLIAPFFPQLAAEKGMNEVTIGFMYAMYQLVMFIMTPVYGLLIVRIGPKFLCVAGCFLCGGSSLLFGLLYYTEQPFFTIMCFITRACEGNGAAMFMVASMTTLIKTLPGSASKTLGIIEMVAGFGYIAGPVVGAGLYALGGYPTPFLSVGVMTLLLSAVLLCLLPRIETEEKQTSNFLRLFKIPGVTILFLHCCVTCLSGTFLEPTFGPYMTSTFKSSTTTIGLLFGAWSGAYALFSPVFGKLADKGYLYSPVIISLFGLVICESLIPPSPLLYSIFPSHQNFAVTAIAMTVFGIFQAGIYIAPFQAVLNLLILDGYSEDIHTYGMISGFINSAYSLGSFSGPMLSGFLTDRYKFPWATTIMSFICTAMGVVLLGYVMFMKVTRRPLHPGDVSETQEQNNNNNNNESIKDVKHSLYGSFKKGSVKGDDGEAKVQLFT